MLDIPDPEGATKVRFTGKLTFRADLYYEPARVAHIFHSRYPDRYPDAVLQAETENDVVEGVRLAKERGWTVAIRSGGHSFPVWSLRDGGLMIDLAGFKEMVYDEETQIAAVTPSVHSGDELNPYLTQFGRFFPGGGCPSVGVGGFLLQGGMGWNFRGWGYASEHVAAIDVVTADGELVRADDQQNSDLFWAARGAGHGYFGAITRFYLKTRPRPKAMTATLQAYRTGSFSDVLPWLFERQKTIADTVHLFAGSMIPPFPIPDHDGGLIFYVLGVAFCDTRDEALAALAPLHECPALSDALLVDANRPTTLEEQVLLADGVHPKGLKYRVDSAWVQGPYDEITEASRVLLAGRPVEELGHTFFQFAIPRAAPDMAMSLISDCMIGAYVIYEDEANDDKYHAWLQSAMAPLQPYSIGQYWGDSDQMFREVKCLTDDAFARVEQIRRVRDPHGVFAGYHAKDTGFRNINGWEVEHLNEAIDDQGAPKS